MWIWINTFTNLGLLCQTKNCVQLSLINLHDFKCVLAKCDSLESITSPWGPGFFLLNRIGPRPFSMACRRRRLKLETNGCFPRNS